jgi:hypothetical protein
MLRSVNAPRSLLLLVLSLAPAACRSSGDAARRTPAAPDAALMVAEVRPTPADGDAGAAPVDPAAIREESARFFPAPYDNLWIGEPMSEFLGDYPDAKPYASRSDPERLEWMERTGENGLLVRFGFGPGATQETKPLRSVQFMSLLPGPTNPEAAPSPMAVAAWQTWMAEAYAPHVQALKEKYGERADVYTCGGGSKHPIVRIVWRGRALAVTEAFMMHDKGLSSTLMVTPLDVAERYLRATQCRWVQDQVL